MDKRAALLNLIDPKGNIYYGGDQSWYSSNTRAMAGCSSVAGANALRMLCKTDSSCKSAVRNSKTIPRPIKNALLSSKCSKDDYLMLMTGVYETMRAFEIFPLNIIYDKKDRNNKFFKYVKANTGRGSIGFIIGLLRFAKKLGLLLKCNALSTAFCSKEDALNYIDEGLKASGSVVLLTSYNKHALKTFSPVTVNKSSLKDELPLSSQCPCGDATMKCHFAIITGRTGDEVLISTWGKVATADIDELVKSWHSIKAWESTLFYFIPTDKAGMRRSLLTSFIPFFKGILQALIRKYI